MSISHNNGLHEKDLKEKEIKEKDITEKRTDSVTPGAGCPFFLKPYWVVLGVLFCVFVILNGLTFVQNFCNFYVDHVFWIVDSVYGRIFSVFPFVVADVLIGIGICVIVLTVAAILLLPFFRKNIKYRELLGSWLKIIMMTAMAVMLILTLNYVIPCRSAKLDIGGRPADEYGAEELEALRNELVSRINELSVRVERGDDGQVVSQPDRDEKVVEAMRGLSKDFGYTRFDGFYTRFKTKAGSKKMYYSETFGMTEALTMESGRNAYVSDLFYPYVYAHELAHFKGYYSEDEATFLAYLACVNSDDIYLQYSACNDVFNYYVEPQYKKSVSTSHFFEQPQLNALAFSDRYACWDTKQTDRYREEPGSRKDEFYQNVSEAEKMITERTQEAVEDYLPQTEYSDVLVYLLQYYDSAE